jgi:pimeloyl-ACP methyl ester carboxylesterase
MSRQPAVSVYDRTCWSDGQLQSFLAAGEHPRELSAYFGHEEFLLLTRLARRAAQTPVRHRTPVYVLPGIMGSQLGHDRPAAPPDLLWLDPTDVIAGRLTRLRPGRGPELRSMGGVAFSYLRLLLRLRAAGFAVVLHDYDWRADLKGLAAEFALRLTRDAVNECAVIGHSMGGLVGRAALRCAGGERIARLITLGTPHGGSIAAVQALRGCYPAVSRLASIDAHHDVAFLTSAVFRHLPSLYQLLPHVRENGIDIVFDRRGWPRRGPQPHPRLLASARDFLPQLGADDRCLAIVGTGQRTATGLARARGEFSYEISSRGDGTVPVASAVLAGAPSYYVRCEHSELPRDALIAQALIDLLVRGRTTRLATRASPRRGGEVRIGDRALRRDLAPKVDWYALTALRRRAYLNRLNAPPASYRRPRR